MKFAVLGGAGAMGALYGGKLAQAGFDVTLVDIARAAVDKISSDGVEITDNSGDKTDIIKVRASTNPAEVGVVDYLLIFTKGFGTEAAIRSAVPMVGDQTTVVTLQNGWGNIPKIASVVGDAHVLPGVTMNSSTLLGPGHIRYTNPANTWIGELDGTSSERVKNFADALAKAGFQVEVTPTVLKWIWTKFALNCTVLGVGALIYAATDGHVFMKRQEGLDKFRENILREVVSVANAQGIDISFVERWKLLGAFQPPAPGTKTYLIKGSMTQDVEGHRRTEIDTLNGAVVEEGKRLGIYTPYNQAIVWLIKALEQSFEEEREQA